MQVVAAVVRADKTTCRTFSRSSACRCKPGSRSYKLQRPELKDSNERTVKVFLFDEYHFACLSQSTTTLIRNIVLILAVSTVTYRFLQFLSLG